MKGKTIEALPLGIDIHRTPVGTPEIQVMVFPFTNIGNLNRTMIIESLYQVILLLLNLIQKTGRK